VSEAWVLDSFALLALLGGEPGADEVARLLREAETGQDRVLMTWVNLGEVAYIVERRHGKQSLSQMLALLEETALELVPADRELTLMAAHIKAEHPIAYTDAFAAALALKKNGVLVTGDPEFQRLEPTIRIHWLSPSSG